jgi:transposase
MSYERKFREKALAYRKKGNTIKATAEVFGIGETTLKKWERMYAKTGSVEDKERKAFFRKIDPEKLRAYVSKHPDAYLHEIAKVFGCATSAVHKALKKMKITLKKRYPRIKNEMKQ